MPLVKRFIKTTTGCAFSTTVHELVLYVSPGQVRRGKDEIIAPTDRQLADLAARFPEEYGAAAKARGIAPVRVRRDRGAFVDPDAQDTFVDLDEDAEEDLAEPEADDEDEAADDDGALSPAAFARLGERQAANVVAATDDEATLAAWFGAETGRAGGPRAGVIAAFTKKTGA